MVIEYSLPRTYLGNI